MEISKLKSRISPQLALAVLVLLLALAVLACGPSAQYHEAPPSVAVGQEGTPEPCPHTEGTYPNLDETLADLVGKYERCELTESEAAAEAPESFGHLVLVEAQTDASHLKTLDTWMGGQGIEPRYATPDHTPPHIYAYAPVSLLGGLSQQEGISSVLALSSPFQAGVTASDEELERTLRADSEVVESQALTLPFWLKGLPYQGSHPKLDSLVRSAVLRYEHDGKDPDRSDPASACMYEGNKMFVTIITSQGGVGTITQWLANQDPPIRPENTYDKHQTRRIVALVPLSLLGELSELVAVMEVTASLCISGDHDYILPESHLEPSDNGTPSEPPKMGLAALVGEGVAAHGADDWHPTYKGSQVKIGIIDSGFYNFNTTRYNDDLPRGSKVKHYCFSGIRSTVAVQNNMAVCESAAGTSYHGVGVTESLFDIAGDAEYYISNARIGILEDTASIRFSKAVSWMIDNGVQVINNSGGYSFAEGLGDGANPGPGSIMDTVKRATDAGIVWVNSVGNNQPVVWHGEYKDTATINLYHEFSGSDEKLDLYKRFDQQTSFGGGQAITVEARWQDDDWYRSDCDLDFYLFKEDSNGNTTVINPLMGTKSQNGETLDRPYERITAEVADVPAGFTYYLQVRKYICNDLRNDLDWLEVTVWTRQSLEYRNTGNNIALPADNEEAGGLSVGAAPHNNTSRIDKESSRGPTNNDATKPDVVGANCGNTLSYPTNYNIGCGFGGTSQAAPHVAGVAALIIDRYEDLWAGEWTGVDVANFVKDMSLPRTSEPAPENTDPNNVWGHGFAHLPHPAPEASFATVPTTIAVGESATLSTLTKNTPVGRVRVMVNNPAEAGRTGDTGRVNFRQSGCPAGTKLTSDLDSGDVTIWGCQAGNVTIRLLKHGTNTLLRVYKVTVTSAPTVELDVSASMVENRRKNFTVTVGNLVLNKRYHLDLTTGNNSIGFDRDCATAKPVPFTARTTSRTFMYAIHACRTPGASLVATLRSGGSAGSVVASDSESIRVEAAPTTGIASDDIPEKIALGEPAPFTVKTSGLVVGDSYTMEVSSDQAGMGFDTSCVLTASDTFTASSAKHSSSFTIHACSGSGGTITSKLVKGSETLDSSETSVSISSPALIPPPAPENVRTSSARRTSILVSWDAVSGASKYRLQYRRGSSGSWTTASSAITGTSHRVTGLTCGRSYQFRVAGFGNGTDKQAVWGGYSSTAAGRTDQCLALIPAPGNVRIGDTTTKRMEVSWDAVTHATRYRVETRQGTSGDWFLQTSSETSTSFTAVALGCGTAYQVRVTAYGDGSNYRSGWGTPATPVSGTTSACLPPPPAPEGLTASEPGRSTAKLTWTALAGAVKYRVDYREDPGGWQESANDITGTEHIVTLLGCETLHKFRISAFGDGETHGEAWGTYSGEVSITTTACQPPVFDETAYSFAVDHTSADGDLVGRVSASDPTPDETLTYSLAGSDQFAIHSTNGNITVAGGLSKRTYNLTATVKDQHGQTASVPVTVVAKDFYTVSFEQTAYSASEGGGTVSVRLNVTPNPPADLTLQVAALAGGTATSGDYSDLPQTVTLLAGNNIQSFSVGIVDDSADEPDETLVLGFNFGAAGMSDNLKAGANAQTTITIGDNDATVTELWSATMTVGEYGLYRGYSSTQDADTAGSLSDTDFDWDGTTFTVNSVLVGHGTDTVALEFDRNLPSDLTGASLVIGTVSMVLSDATAFPKALSWTHQMELEVGATVTIKIAEETE